MANNLIQIKRSLNTAVPSSLANGELAFTSNGDVLYIGANGTTFAIAGKRGTPGTLTANQAPVVNSTLGIDKWIVANLVPQFITANGGLGTSGYVLKSGGASTNVYWDVQSSGVAGSSTQVQYNDGGSTLAGAVGFTYDKNTNNVQIANSLNIPANGAFGNTTGGGTLVNSTSFAAGNSTVNAVHTASLIQVSSATSVANLSAVDLKIGATTVVNSTQITATLFSGNLSGSYANISGQVNAATIYATTSANIASAVQANSTGVWTTGVVNAATIQASVTFTANSTLVNAAAINITGQVNTATVYATTSVNIASAAVYANSTGVWTTGTANALNFIAGAGYSGASAGMTANSGTVGISSNSTVLSTMTSTYVQVSNSTSTSNITPIGVNVGANVSANTTALKVGTTTFTSTAATLGGTLSSNGSTGTSGFVLVSGGSTNAYWSNTIPGVFSFTDVTVSGNLTVLGDLVSLNVATLAIEDPLIVFAKDQASTTAYTDAVDIGFIAPYGNTTTANSNWTGFFRDQSDSGVYKLFSGNIPTPTTTVDTTNTNFSFATLQAQLKAGGPGATAFVANTTVVNITANSTVAVGITANTLSLTTALPATSGGTGKTTIGTGSLLVGNASNVFTELTAGTDGYVLQINGTGVVAWNTLDGGTF
jgi:hypothetical protein